MTEVYDYNIAPLRRGILDMSRGTKSKAVSGKMEMVDYFRMLNSRLDEQEKRSDSRYEALQEDLRNTNQRLEELQLRVPRHRLADIGIQEGSPVSSRESPRRLEKEELPRLYHSDSSRCYHRSHRGCRHNRR